MRILVTGCAGFIGFHLTRRLLDRGDVVFGVDNLNSYYEPRLKRDRLALLDGRPGFTFEKLNIANQGRTADLFRRLRPQKVIHLAAQAGIRYSLTNPRAYVDSNLVAFTHILEGCRHHGVENLTYASSSSVYGANTLMPFSEHHNVDHPLSLYAATKKANELMAHSYSHLYGLPTTGLRFFTVYGPWGRPDMVMFLFTKAILGGHPIDVFNQGRMKRDFTYIGDIVESVLRIADQTATPNPAWNGDAPDPATSKAPFRIYNIGNSNPVELLYLIEVLEKCLGKSAHKRLLPMQAGDVPATFADADDLARAIDFKPSTSIEDGVRWFADWYVNYYRRDRAKGRSRSSGLRSAAELEKSSLLNEKAGRLAPA